jgi:hypothetical protein
MVGRPGGGGDGHADRLGRRALPFDFTNTFHASANAIATVVATQVLRPHLAVAWAALFNFIPFRGRRHSEAEHRRADGRHIHLVARAGRLRSGPERLRRDSATRVPRTPRCHRRQPGRRSAAGWRSHAPASRALAARRRRTRRTPIPLRPTAPSAGPSACRRGRGRAARSGSRAATPRRWRRSSPVSNPTTLSSPPGRPVGCRESPAAVLAAGGRGGLRPRSPISRRPSRRHLSGCACTAGCTSGPPSTTCAIRTSRTRSTPAGTSIRRSSEPGTLQSRLRSTFTVTCCLTVNVTGFKPSATGSPSPDPVTPSGGRLPYGDHVDGSADYNLEFRDGMVLRVRT